jgi:hypothetical protein
MSGIGFAKNEFVLRMIVRICCRGDRQVARIGEIANVGDGRPAGRPYKINEKHASI